MFIGLDGMKDHIRFLGGDLLVFEYVESQPEGYAPEASEISNLAALLPMSIAASLMG
jgi:hypothetical protein